MRYGKTSSSLSQIAPLLTYLLRHRKSKRYNEIIETLEIKNHTGKLPDILSSYSLKELTKLENKIKKQFIKNNINIDKINNNNIIVNNGNNIDQNEIQSKSYYFGNNKEITRFGMIVAIVCIMVIVFFTYQSLSLDDKNLHFVREVISFIEGSLIMLIMQYFFGNFTKSIKK